MATLSIMLRPVTKTRRPLAAAASTTCCTREIRLAKVATMTRPSALCRTFMNVLHKAEGRVIVATFASLISRVQQVVDAAAASGRRVFVTGRSMMDNVAMARERGYLNFPRELSMNVNDLRSLPDHQICIITTGS